MPWTVPVITVAVDWEAWGASIANTAPDLAPVPGKVARDHEYKRLGTCSILAAVDLHDGHITARVERRHASHESILLLKDLDAYYPPQCSIRVILDNHSAHLSQENRDYLATQPPHRFHYVLHSQAWIVVEPGRDYVREDGPDFSSPPPRPVLGGTPRPHPVGCR